MMEGDLFSGTEPIQLIVLRKARPMQCGQFELTEALYAVLSPAGHGG